LSAHCFNTSYTFGSRYTVIAFRSVVMFKPSS
jgi:hypothetical protein